MALNINNNLLSPSKIARIILLATENNMAISKNVDWSLDSEFKIKTDKPGKMISIRRPLNATVKDTFGWTGDLPVETSIPLEIDQQRQIDLSFSDEDMALKVEEFQTRYTDAVASKLALSFDIYVYSLAMKGTYNVVGQYGTAITSDTFLAAREKLLSYGCPDDGNIFGVLTLNHERSFIGEVQKYITPVKEIGEIYKKAVIGIYAGIEWSHSNSSERHVDGNVWTGSVGSITVSAQSPLTSGWADTDTITVNGFTAGRTLKVGDVFSLSGASGVVTQYNPDTKSDTGYTQQFVVIEDVASTTSAGQVVKISPALITDGPYKNIDGNLNGSVSLIGYSESGKTAGSESLVFHKNAIKCVSPDMTEYSDTIYCKVLKADSGFKYRFTKASNMFGVNGPFVGAQLHALFGAVLARREWVCRVR